MKTKAEILLKRMSLLYENIYALLNGYQQAADNSSNNILVNLKNEDGTVKQVSINSFNQLQQEINRIDNNFKAISNPNSYVLNGDGSVSMYQKISFFNAEYLEKFSFDGSNCVISKTNLIEDLVYPTIQLPISIGKQILGNQVHCKIYEITSGFENIEKENIKQVTLDYLNNIGKVTYKTYERILPISKQQIKFFGKFNIETVEQQQNDFNSFNITLSDIKYSSLNNIGNNINLKNGDILVSEDGQTKFKITMIDTLLKLVTLQQIGGFMIPKVGEQLLFNEIIDSKDDEQINLPIKPNQKLIVFFSTENNRLVSYPSNGLVIDTTDFKVVVNSNIYTIDEYFQKYVSNFSDYLKALIDDTTIPYALGIKPNKPKLISENFKVVQINKHLVDNKTQQTFTELNKKKQSIQNEIDYKQTLINQTQNEIDTLKYTSIEDKNYRLNKVIQLRTEINTLKSNLLTVTRDIDNNAEKYGLKNISPKYKVIGFWEMEDSLYSPKTRPQKIIKYEVQYRYLTKDVDVSDTTTYKMISNGKEITVAFSDWVLLNTRTLNKVESIDGSLQWEQPLLDSVNDININQAAISIKAGESIEIKVRAVTEAGWPISPMKSEWSETLRVDFPEDLKTNNLQASVSQNNIDLNKAEFNEILINSGLISHIAGTIKESEKTFLHSATDIASGQYTPEQKNIPLDVCIKNILNEISILKQQDISQNIIISFIDFDNETYTITNNSTLEIFGGNYMDNFDDIAASYGSIVRKKGYIRIKNNNSVPVELKTLVPGNTLTQVNAENYYNVPVLIGDSIMQNPKQILYFRNIDIIGQTNVEYRLVRQFGETDKTFIPLEFLNTNVTDDKKNIVTLENDGSIGLCKLKDSVNNSDFACFTTEHPNWKYNEKDLMKPEFTRLKNLVNSNLKADVYQSEAKNGLVVGFKDNDKYMVGRYTCGAFLYPYINKPNLIQVVGNTTVSTLIINKDSELLIPIIFEYRMTDRLGRINGEASNLSLNDSLSYTKTIGVDMLLNNNLFKFDLKVTANYRSKVSSIKTKNITGLLSNFTNEGKAELI